MTGKIAFLPGDGVGPEVAEAARRVMMRAGEIFGLAMTFEEFDFGGAAIDRHGDPLPAKTLNACLNAQAVFLGAVGGPQWEKGGPRPETGLLALRKNLGVFANLRPIRVMPGKESLSPLKDDVARGADILIIRELTGGLYFGDKVEGDESASDNCAYTREEVTRIAKIAFEAARARRGRVTSVDKANVMATSRLWRAAVIALHEAEYGDVELEHVLVDAMAMKLIQHPAQFDVVLTENLFGDILSDEASVIAGSIGLAPSASLGEGVRGLYEPIHGSAPDIAGLDKANPVGAILSGAMLLRFSLNAEGAARAIECAVEETIKLGFGTRDIGGADSCSEFAGRVAAALAR
ncbi:MAG: 3-isopropylmalate dehydrogenase [Parvularculaceae bacterium]|nr:3-isopropylmalate dehydrogenase [Parvularculaceae bacterium]